MQKKRALCVRLLSKKLGRIWLDGVRDDARDDALSDSFSNLKNKVILANKFIAIYCNF